MGEEELREGRVRRGRESDVLPPHLLHPPLVRSAGLRYGSHPEPYGLGLCVPPQGVSWLYWEVAVSNRLCFGLWGGDRVADPTMELPPL